MRLVIALALLLGTLGIADAAQPHWLSTLLGINAAPAHHTVSKPRAMPTGPAPVPAERPADLDKAQQPTGEKSPAPEPAAPEAEAPGATAPQSTPVPAPEDSKAPASPGAESHAVPLPLPRPAEPAAESSPAGESQSSPAKPELSGKEAAPPSGASSPSTSTGSEPAGQSHAPRVFETACPAVVMGQVEAEAKPPIAQQQCVARSPLTLTGVMVNGHKVAIQGGVTSDCAVATMLPLWLGQVDGYVWSRLNTRLKAITVGTSFMCRDRRTGEPNDTLSEHAFADALDVTSFTLENGKTVSVSSDWMPADGEDGRMLRFTHNAACSLFMTTLGPEANALHHDHFHVDMGCHGKTCTFRMCQ